MFSQGFAWHDKGQVQASYAVAAATKPPLPVKDKHGIQMPFLSSGYEILGSDNMCLTAWHVHHADVQCRKL